MEKSPNKQADHYSRSMTSDLKTHFSADVRASASGGFFGWKASVSGGTYYSKDTHDHTEEDTGYTTEQAIEDSISNLNSHITDVAQREEKIVKTIYTFNEFKCLWQLVLKREDVKGNLHKITFDIFEMSKKKPEETWELFIG